MICRKNEVTEWELPVFSPQICYLLQSMTMTVYVLFFSWKIAIGHEFYDKYDGVN